MKYLCVLLTISLASLSVAKAEVQARRKSCGELLGAYRAIKSELAPSVKLVFNGVGKRDVYNPTKPFVAEFNGERVEVMAARVEARDSEESEVIFFTEKAGLWSPLEGAPEFKMQDPFFTFINGELILGGVEIFLKSPGNYGYKTIFMRGQNLQSLKRFTEGPLGMKDIRLVQLKDNRIGLFTRPQGRIPGSSIDAGGGKIGFKIISSLDELTVDNIIKTPLIKGQFANNEWGGANEAQLLPNGKIAVLAHLARFDEQKNRHYYSAAFTIEVQSGVASPLELILERKDLTGGLDGSSKREDLRDVVFSGGLALKDGHAVLYVGAGDAEVHRQVMPIPKILLMP